MCKAIAFATLFALFSSPAAAADWLKLTSWPDGHGGKMEVFIDTDSERETLPNEYHGVIKEFWVKLTHPGGSYDEAEYAVDCGARTFSLLSAGSYDKLGSEVRTYSKEFATPIPPDSLTDFYRITVCPK